MVWVWVVTTAFVVATFITVKLRGNKKMPHALRDAIAADAIFGALLLLRAFLWRLSALSQASVTLASVAGCHVPRKFEFLISLYNGLVNPKFSMALSD
jgi:hypothetical protein